VRVEEVVRVMLPSVAAIVIVKDPVGVVRLVVIVAVVVQFGAQEVGV